MAELSEKLELESARELTRAVQAWEREDEGIEADRRATVEAVAKWLAANGSTFGADAIRRELLSEGEGDG